MYWHGHIVINAINPKTSKIGPFAGELWSLPKRVIPAPWALLLCPAGERVLAQAPQLRHQLVGREGSEQGLSQNPAGGFSRGKSSVVWLEPGGSAIGILSAAKQCETLSKWFVWSPVVRWLRGFPSTPCKNQNFNSPNHQSKSIKGNLRHCEVRAS